MSQIKAVLLGANGYWAKNVLRNLLLFPELDVVCIDPAFATSTVERDFELKHPYFKSKTFATFKDCLRFYGKPEVAFVCTPINTHYVIAKELLEHNIHCLVQKPLCDSSEQAGYLTGMAIKNKLVLLTAFTYLYNPAIQEIFQYIDFIGKAYSFKSLRMNLGIFDRNNSVSWDLLPHDFSILLYLFPSKYPKWISATGLSHLKNAPVDTVTVTVGYDDDFQASIDVSWLSAVKIRQIYVTGSEKTIVFDDCKNDYKVSIYDAGVKDDKLRFSYTKGRIESPKLPETEAIYNEISYFLSCVRNQVMEQCDLQRSVKVIKMIEATNQSVAMHGSPVNL